MKITDLSILCKWETLKNRQCIKYLFAPLYVLVNVMINIYIYCVFTKAAFFKIKITTVEFVFILKVIYSFDGKTELLTANNPVQMILQKLF